MPAPAYLLVFLVPALAAAALAFGGLWTLATPLFVFGLVPLLELVLPPRPANAPPAVEAARRASRAFDAVLYLTVPVQLGHVLLLMALASNGALAGWELLGATASVGICCGGLGINVAHELGHRPERRHTLTARLMLLSTLYMHFFVEHNRGHHARVATPEDPATARRGETLYAFWWRSVADGFRSAWRMAADLELRRGRRPFGPRNEIVLYVALQATAVAGAAWAFGWRGLLPWLGASLVGILLLETVNYVEHYGLLRSRDARRRWEPVRPVHSWNSDHPLGRVLLFELSRHSDHHANPKRPYALLRSMEGAPQLPFGYPAMLLLAAVPPLFFAVMDRALAALAPSTAQQSLSSPPDTSKVA
jgi:alkane 1-monooxygenase